METHRKIHKIELEGDDFKEKGLRIRVVKIYLDENNYTCLTIEELKKILRLWIIGEEERYPPPRFRGRWMLFDEIKKIFEEDFTEEVQKDKFNSEEKQTTL